MVRLAMPVLAANPLTTCAMTLESTAYLALSPMRARLAVFLGTAGSGTRWSGLSAGAPSIRRVFGVFREISKSPLLTTLVIFQMLALVFVWIGIARAMLRSLRASVAYRLWTLYPVTVAVVLLVMAAGGEADARFRLPVIPLLAVAASLGYFPRSNMTNRSPGEGIAEGARSR